MRWSPFSGGGGSTVDTSLFVLKSLFDANTILAANSDNTPAAVTIAEQRIVGRKTGGNIAALEAADVLLALGLPATLTITELGYMDGVTSAVQTQLDGKEGAFVAQDLGTMSGDGDIDFGSGRDARGTVTAAQHRHLLATGLTKSCLCMVELTANAAYTVTFYSGSGTTAVKSSGNLLATWTTSGATNKVDRLLFWYDITDNDFTAIDVWPDVRNA